MRVRMDQVLIRLPIEVHNRIRHLAEESGISQAETCRNLLAECLGRGEKPLVSPPQPGSPDREMDLHLLVAVEQLIALVESIHPRGPGASAHFLNEAVLAAQRRLELEAD